MPVRSSRIVGGQDAKEGEWPWQVSLHVKNYGHQCGASIISERWLVTAAHCLEDDPRFNIRLPDPASWEVYLGLHSQRHLYKAKKHHLKKMIIHPNYKFNDFDVDYDIALLELDQPATFSDTIRPICLPSAAYIFPVGKSVWITGWGAIREGGPYPTVLQKAEVQIMYSALCNMLMNGEITLHMTCAGFISGGDTCQRDSGGPMSASNAAGRMFLAGVVSWGYGCARPLKPGVYTTEPIFRAWIKEQTGV